MLGGHNRRRRLAPRSSGKQQAGRTAVRTAPIVCPEESPQCAHRRIPLPRQGLTRRLRREERACSPMGRSHFSFGGERKVCKRKPAARRLREKGFYCPFWRRGSLCRAQHSWPAYAYHRARSELAFFRRQNGRAFFPPLPIAALLRRSWRWAYLPPCGLGCFGVAGKFCGADKEADFLFPQSAVGKFTPCGLGCFDVA